MNNLKNKAGFTLVELIVVIAILAILAGVAVPAYTGYIAKAEEAAMLQQLSTVNTAAQGLAAAEGATVDGITVTKDDSGITIVVTSDKDTGTGNSKVYAVTADEVKALTGDLTLGDSFESAAWANGKWTITRATANDDAE